MSPYFRSINVFCLIYVFFASSHFLTMMNLRIMLYTHRTPLHMCDTLVVASSDLLCMRKDLLSRYFWYGLVSCRLALKIVRLYACSNYAITSISVNTFDTIIYIYFGTYAMVRIVFMLRVVVV